MARSDQIRRGMILRHEGELFTVLDYSLAQTGKQKPTMHVKLRSLKSGHTGERTTDELGRIEEVATEIRPMQYLYASGNQRVFMDNESYEQYSLSQDILGDSLHFLVEEDTYRFLTVEGQPVALQLPTALVMKVVDTAPVEHAGGSSSVHKEARLASGLVIHVPLFIKTGDKVRVSTENRQYQGKAP